MAYSKEQYTGTGGQALYTVPFPYINKKYVELSIGPTPLVEGVGYSWASPASILLSSNLPSGSVLYLRRNTPKDVRIVDFSDGSFLTEDNLDSSALQVFHVVQEALDSITQSLVPAGDSAAEAALSAAAALTYRNEAQGFSADAAANAVNVWSAIATIEGGGVMVHASPTDAVAGTLDSKMEVSGDIVKTLINPGADEKLRFTVTIPPSTRQIPVGTPMLFMSAAAPLGWTQVTTHNNKALRLVSGTGGASGGSVAFSTVFGRTASDASSLSIAQLAAHSHTVNTSSGSPGSSAFTSPDRVSGSTTATSSQGSGSTHSHGMDLRVQYVDTIICTKD